MKITLTNIKQLEGDVQTFTFDSKEITSWKPGQFLHVILKHSHPDDRGVERWFTISSTPSEGEIAITTRIVTDRPSSFKQALAALKQGEEIEVDEPEGDFTLENLNRNYIFVAGGIGVTPFRSIIKEVASKGNVPNIIILYANRDDQVIFKQELEDISKTNPKLKIEYIFSPEKIDKERLQKTIELMDNPIVYVSGPEPMVEAFEKDLQEIGLSKENIKTDFFPGYEAF